MNADLILEGLNDVKPTLQDRLLKCIKQGEIVVEVDKNYYRPTEVDLLIGDASKAEKILNWKPKTKFEELVKIMINADFEKVLKRGY